MCFFLKYICIELLHKVYMVFIFDKCVKIIYVMSISCNEIFILTQVIEEGLEFDGHMPPVKILLKILRTRFKEGANN